MSARELRLGLSPDRQQQFDKLNRRQKRQLAAVADERGIEWVVQHFHQLYLEVVRYIRESQCTAVHPGYSRNRTDYEDYREVDGTKLPFVTKLAGPILIRGTSQGRRGRGKIRAPK